MRVALAAVVALLLAACSTPTDSAGPDASAGPQPDAETVVGQDASTAPGQDAAQPVPSDGAVAPGADTGTSPGLDAAAVAGPDAAAVAGPDAAAVVWPDASSPAPDAASGTDPATACAAAADAICTQLETCSSFGLKALYGDLATCKARVVLGCLPVYGSPGSSATPARTQACALALEKLTCDVVKSGDYGPDCAAVPGSFADGAACGDDSQCQSNFCARASTSLCGTCSPKSTEGGACVNGACSAGLSCPSGSTTCIKPVAGKVGDACTYLEQCDLANGVACDTMSSKKCIQVSVATGAGAACGLSMTGFSICPGTGSCSAVFGGTCSAAAADGASCSDSDTGPKCLTPAKCVGGTCKLPDPASCK